MALKFTPASENPQVTEATPVAVVTEPAEAQMNYSIIEATRQIKHEIVKNEEVDKLVNTININDVNSVVKFGDAVATEISKASDQVLSSMNMNQVNDSGELLKHLGAIMAQFDAKELADEGKKGIISNIKKSVDRILSKYQTMGDDVDKIYVQLKKYENEIEVANVKLETMFNANIRYYKDLLLYIMAGEQACVELDNYITDYRVKLADNPDSGAVAMDLQTLEQTRQIFEQRVMDLKIAENVAMQTVPMLKAMQFSNLNLIRKINSAFIITMPIFKQSLAQALMLKRQRIQAEAMSALDEKTNEMLLKNARNTVEQTKLTTQMASGSSIKVETLEQTWQTIVEGIEETRRIQDNAKVQREQDAIRLQKLKEDYREKMNKAR
ncbi:MAG: toxic anion resistance protein [Oscillospiraceae bacterium]|nr:toxic anion resistance protein [Oscillospiraceae bacterium]